MLPGLTGHELVAHVFVVATGPDAEAGYRHLVALWATLRGDPFRIDLTLAAWPDTPPDVPPAGDGVLAVRVGRTEGRHEAVLRRAHDVLCLSVLSAPTPGSGPTWDTLDDRWRQVYSRPAKGLIGSVLILQARLADAATAIDAGLLEPLDAVIRRQAGVPEDWACGGVLRPEPPLGPFVIAEPTDPAAAQPDGDGRADRRIVVVAANDRDPQLSAWTWTRGDERLTPLARYLLHAAKMRYELRLWHSDQARNDLRARTDRAVAPLLHIAAEVAETGRDPDADALLTASVPLIRLQAAELGLVDRASRLRDVHRTVEIAATNMAAYARGDQDSGLFADDKQVASWLLRQLDHDATFLDGAAVRVRSVAALGDQLVQRGLTGRQERFNLGLTGVVGAVLMTLAAMQTFKYDLPKPELAPALIAVLAAFTLLLSMVVLRTAAPRRRLPAVALCLSAGLLGAAAGWLAVAAVGATAGVAIWVTVGGAVGVIGSWFAVRAGGARPM